MCDFALLVSIYLSLPFIDPPPPFPQFTAEATVRFQAYVRRYRHSFNNNSSSTSTSDLEYFSNKIALIPPLTITLQGACARARVCVCTYALRYIPPPHATYLPDQHLYHPTTQAATRAWARRARPPTSSLELLTSGRSRSLCPPAPSPAPSTTPARRACGTTSAATSVSRRIATRAP